MRYVAALLLVCAIAGNHGVNGAKVGGKIAPDGQEIQIDFPESLMRANTSSRGQGCCVFTSIHHAALWQNIPQLQEFPKWLQAKGLTGGGYPGNVDERIKRICAERGMPIPSYIQIFGKVPEDIEIIKLALANGRQVVHTYGKSPTGRYQGQGIDHMVNGNHCLNGQFCVMDNNYVRNGVADYEWMDEAEWRRAYTYGSRGPGTTGWAVIFVDNGFPPPPPLPWN